MSDLVHFRWKSLLNESNVGHHRLQSLFAPVRELLHTCLLSSFMVFLCETLASAQG